MTFPSYRGQRRSGKSLRLAGGLAWLYTHTFSPHHTNGKIKRNMKWAQGEICGFQQSVYAKAILNWSCIMATIRPHYVRTMFSGLFEHFLNQRDLEITRYQSVICKKCDASLARNVVMDQLQQEKRFQSSAMNAAKKFPCQTQNH